jgi:hypothetical protein
MIAIRCTVCRKRLPDDGQYCAYCGARLPEPPGPLPSLRLDRPGLKRLGLGLALGLPLGLAFWLPAGLLAGWTWQQGLLVSGLLGGLTGLASGFLHARLFWPISYRPALIRESSRLPLLYGVAGGLALLAGGAPIGLVVLLIGWNMASPTVEALFAGAFAGAISLRVAVPLGALAGMLTGLLVARLGRRMRGTLGLALAAGLAWVNAGAVGGALVGLIVAGRVDLSPSLGAFAGALIQIALAVLLLPWAARAARRMVIYWYNRP